jgi:hypothetical protein
LVGEGARVDIKDSEGKTVMDHVNSLEKGKEEMLVALQGSVKIESEILHTCPGHRTGYCFH